jgi:hypothetical protein
MVALKNQASLRIWRYDTAALPKKRPGPPKGYMPKYPPVKQLPLPHLDDPLLLERAAGLHEGEEGSYCINETLRIAIAMCSKDALERIQPVFGTKVTRCNSRKCERAEENPEGFDYRLSRDRRFAKLIMETFVKRGLSKEKSDQYHHATRKCEELAQTQRDVQGLKPWTEPQRRPGQGDHLVGEGAGQSKEDDPHRPRDDDPPPGRMLCDDEQEETPTPLSL